MIATNIRSNYSFIASLTPITYFATFISILSTTFTPTPARKHDPRRVLLLCITPELFSTCAPENKQALFQQLTALTSVAPSAAATEPSPATNEADTLQTTAREVLASVLHDATLLAGYLQQFAENAEDSKEKEWGVMVTAILEVLRSHITELADAHLAVAPLFALLPHIHTPKTKEDESESESESDSEEIQEDEYVVQLALGCIGTILRHLRERRKLGETVKFPKETVCDVDFVVKILEGILVHFITLFSPCCAESKTIMTASMVVQALGAVAYIYPARVLPKLEQLCVLLAGNPASDEEEEDEEKDDNKEDEKADEESEEDDDMEEEDDGDDSMQKEGYRFNLLLTVQFFFFYNLNSLIF